MPSQNNTQQCRWHAFDTVGELEQAATRAILNAAQQAITQRGAFHIVLTGGRTPRRLYEMLREAHTDWAAWHVYFGDERCLPPAHEERNSRMAALAWLDHVAIPHQQIHPMPAELGAEVAASNYAQTLKMVGLFDVVLLGLGEDGHIASLFPGHYLGDTSDAPSVVAVHDAPKPPPDRVSLSAQRLSATHQLMFLVTGDAKRQAIKDWRSGVAIPATSIVPGNGVDVYLEAGLLVS